MGKATVRTKKHLKTVRCWHDSPPQFLVTVYDIFCRTPIHKKGKLLMDFGNPPFHAPPFFHVYGTLTHASCASTNAFSILTYRLYHFRALLSRFFSKIQKNLIHWKRRCEKNLSIFFTSPIKRSAWLRLLSMASPAAMAGTSTATATGTGGSCIYQCSWNMASKKNILTYRQFHIGIML